jgi:WD40 repeat protein
MRFFQFALASGLLAGLALLSWADDQPSKEKPKEGKKVTSEEIKRLVQQLGDDEFTKRAEAKKLLEDIGEPAIEILKKTAETTDDTEIRTTANAIIEAYEKRNSGLIRIFRGHGERVNGVAISRDGKRAVSACWDGVVRYWNVESGDLIREMGRRIATIQSAAISPDGKRALTGSTDRTMYLWDLESGEMLRAFSGHNHTVWDVAFSPDGKQALSGCSDGIARHWDLESGEELHALRTVDNGRAWTVAFAADGKQAITGGGSLLDNKGRTEVALLLWDLSTGKQIRQFKGHTADIRRVAVSPDGKQLLSGSFDGTMRLWDIEPAKEIRKFDGPGHFVESVSFTPDGKRAICSYGPKTKDAIYNEDARCSVRLWDLATGKELKQFRGHTGPVLSVAISGDGTAFMSGSADATMRLWKLPK